MSPGEHHPLRSITPTPRPNIRPEPPSWCPPSHIRPLCPQHTFYLPLNTRLRYRDSPVFEKSLISWSHLGQHGVSAGPQRSVTNHLSPPPAPSQHRVKTHICSSCPKSKPHLHNVTLLPQPTQGAFPCSTEATTHPCPKSVPIDTSPIPALTWSAPSPHPQDPSTGAGKPPSVPS